MHCDIWSITRDFLVFDGLRYIGSLEASHGVVWPVGMTLFFFFAFFFSFDRCVSFAEQGWYERGWVLPEYRLGLNHVTWAVK